MALYKVLGTLEGTTPVQLQNPMYQHPSEPLYKIRTPISKKRLKTEEDYITLSRLDFLMSCHWQVGDTDDCDCTVDSNGNVTFTGFKNRNSINFSLMKWHVFLKPPSQSAEII